MGEHLLPGLGEEKLPRLLVAQRQDAKHRYIMSGRSQPFGLGRIVINRKPVAARSCQESFEIHPRHPDPGAGPIRDFASHERVLDAPNRLRQLLGQLHFRSERTQIGRSRFSLDPPFEKIARAAYQLFEFLATALTDHRIGIFAGRNFRDADGEIVLEQRVQRAFRRFLSRHVRVETKDDFADKAFQDSRLVVR